jgi:hypothetical protein
MRFLGNLLFLLILGVIPAKQTFADFKSCQKLIEKLAIKGPATQALASSLYRIEARTAQGSLLEIQDETSVQSIKEHNQQIKQALREPLLGRSGEGLRAVTQKEADAFVKNMAKHPVNGAHRESQYDPEECFGFCFGRASLIHHEAIQKNIDPEAIRKIWAVGSLEKEKWHFHVSTILKAQGRGTWWATDTIYKSAISVETWMDRMERSSDDGRLMLFVTDPRRFSVYSPQFYTGLDLLGDGRSDYYNGYFRDYFEFTLRKKTPKLSQ